MFKPFGACDVKEDSECSFSSMTVHNANRNDTQIEDLSLWSMCLDFDPASFQAFQPVKKRTIDRRITSELSQSL